MYDSPVQCALLNYKFTGKERDTESGLDEFGARYYSSSIGRFMIPDWAAKPTSVPYANFGNPQSLNLYSYVQNNPTTTRDPDGHDGLWVVDKQTDQVTLIIPVHITGSAATPANVSAIVNRDNTLNTNGSPVKIQVVETEKPINGVLNKVDFSSGYDQTKYPGAGEGTNKLGGNEAHINSDNGQATDAAAHDILHFAGIKDQYQEGPRDAQGKRTSTPTPGYNNSNIMTSRSGTDLKPEQVQEAKQNQTTKQCTSDNGKTTCK
jgi:RHS repeat-associated protein